MNIYCFSIPISDYYGENAFQQKLFLSSKSCPTEKQVINELEKLHLTDSKYMGYAADWKKCINTIIEAKDFPFLDEGLSYSSSFAGIELKDKDNKCKWVVEPISVEIVNPIPISE